VNVNDLKNIVKKPNRVRHAYTQSINAMPDEVFPLLCPVRELVWAPGWQTDWVISNSGVAEQGCVFQTSFEEDTAAAIWVISKHHPETYEVEMYKIIPQYTVMKLEASLTGDGKGGTLATIAYEFTPLSPEGEHFLESRTEDWYRNFMQGWESAMNHYLATGEMAA